MLQGRIAFEPQRQFFFDAVRVLLEQLHSVVPRRAVHRPMFVVNFVDPQQQTLLVLSHIGEPFQIHGHRNFKIQCFEFGDRVRDQIVVFQRRNRQFDACHPTQLFGPQTRSIHDVFARDCALVRDDFPSIRRLDQIFDFGMFEIGGAPFFCRNCIGMDGACGINISFAVGPKRTQNTVGRHDRAAFLCLFRGHQFTVFDAHRLEHAIR